MQIPSLSNVALLVVIVACSGSTFAARKIRNTGGAVVFEEHYTVPELLFQVPDFMNAQGGTNAELKANLVNIENRIPLMDQNNIDFMILSCATPCVQGFSDPEQANQLAVSLNNRLAATIANNTERFGGFAALSMHNATVAAQELRRAVTKLGFVGALLNDYQASGADGQTPLYYDQPQYDVFWQTVTELDVPVYLHPQATLPIVASLDFSHAPALLGPVQEYAVTLSTHILGLCVNGVFDRFPNLKIIVGHLGERIPSDFIRIDTTLLRLGDKLIMKKNVTTYFQTNIFETTSGNFSPDLLNFHATQIGSDRILYSIDYPYVNIPAGTAFLERLSQQMRQQEIDALSRGRAMEIFHLQN
ncbi:hypothetical protein BJ165DRAFT_1613696 [Panaeolus papilionaceus]|nr:hypothetical protein BJ165DRAFT_1613696 [Panaeolus papilionaceus]